MSPIIILELLYNGQAKIKINCLVNTKEKERLYGQWTSWEKIKQIREFQNVTVEELENQGFRWELIKQMKKIRPTFPGPFD